MLAGLLALGSGCEREQLHTGDLPELREMGRLRVLLPPRNEQALLPRDGSPLSLERELVENFAKREELEPVWVRVDRFADLIPALLEGRGDVIAANLTVTDERREQIAFTVPLGRVREQLVTHEEDTELRKPPDLAGRRVAVRRSSSFWPTVEALQREVPELELVALPEDVDTEEALYRVSVGELDLTVADSNIVEQVRHYLPEIRVAFDLAKDRAIAWGVRPDAPKLRDALSEFLETTHLVRSRPERYRDDLPGILRRKVLRVITRNSSATYFIWKGELRGFEYELARHFAHRLGVRVEMVVAPTPASLIPLLVEGHGDVIAAAYTIQPERKERGIAFSRPYHYVSEMVVTRARDRGLQSLADLAGRELWVHRRSSYWRTLQRLREREGIPFELTPAPQGLSTEELIDGVAEGDYDLTAADSHIVAIERSWRDDIRAAFALGEPVPHGWAVRAGDRELLAAINRFFRKEYRGTFYNVIRERYFGSPEQVRRHAEERAARGGALSPYDDRVRPLAEEYGFDWRLIVAQMYQESRFDPSARSSAGAVGLLQVLPRTAAELGFRDLEDPEIGLRAGIEYLRHLVDRLEGRVIEPDRLWFALAAYNAGYGHIQDGQRLARRLGYDPRRWSENVERALPLLAREEYHRHARFGYCRCNRPVRYVREIRARYHAYRDATGEGRAAGVRDAGVRARIARAPR